MKAKQVTAKIQKIQKIKPDVFLISLSQGYLIKTAKPGQFLHIKIKNTILRRPISIHSIKDNLNHILFRVRGKGTKILSQYKSGDELDIIGPLGNGFAIRKLKIENRKSTNILIAGGIGVAPLVFLGQKLKETPNTKFQNTNIVILGVKTKKDILAAAEFKKLGFKVLIATEDGSAGAKGFVTDILKSLLQASRGKLQANVYSCGPEPMFAAIHKVIKGNPRINCQVSFEQFMGCGMGYCCGCTIETKHGYKKVCKDGPVFDINEVF
jgi:dihydroorotate dehydrogenase electron transfer subunit